VDNINQELRVSSVIHELEKERDAIKDELLRLTAEYDVKLKKLEKIIETNEERVKQLEQLKDAIQLTKSGLRFIAAPELGNSDDVMMLAISVIN